MKVLRNTILSKRKNIWRQGARLEAGAVILSSNCRLLCIIDQQTLHMENRGGPREAYEDVREAL